MRGDDMKRLVRVSVFLMFLILLTGCEALVKEKSYELDDSHIIFELPKVWEEEGTSDAELVLSRDTANMTIDTIHPSELDSISVRQLLDQKVSEVMKDKITHSLVKEYPVNHLADRNITSYLYTANKDNIETEYYFSVLDFTGRDTYVYVLYEATETYMKYNIDDINRMLMRMRWNGSTEDLAMR